MADEEKQKYLDAIKEFCLMDDTFMSKVFEDKGCAELLLRIILDNNDLTVTKVHVQHEIKNLQGRSIRLDIYAVDTNGKEYNVEVQRTDSGAIPQRARYNSSLMDANIISVGDNLKNLPETHVVFITEQDTLGENELIYRIERTVNGKRPFHDGSHIIYVNGACREGRSPLALLMQDFFCKDPKKMNFSKLAERANFFKTNHEGVSNMCKIMEDLIAKGEAKGEAKGKLDTLKSLVKEGFISISVAAQKAGMTEEAFKKIACL